LSDAVAAVLTVTADDDAVLGAGQNGAEIIATVTGDFVTTDVDPTGGTGNVVVTLGCTPYFS